MTAFASKNEELAELKLLGGAHARRALRKKTNHARVCARLAVSENLRGGLTRQFGRRVTSRPSSARADVGGRFHPLRRAATPLPVHPPIICAPRHLHRRRARIFRPAESGAADSENKSRGRRRFCINTVNWRGRRRRRRHRDAILWLEMARARLREVGMDRLLQRSLYRPALGRCSAIATSRRRCSRRALARRSRQRRANDWARRWAAYSFRRLRASGCSPRLWPSTMAIGAASARARAAGLARSRSCLRCSWRAYPSTRSQCRAPSAARGCGWPPRCRRSTTSWLRRGDAPAAPLGRRRVDPAHDGDAPTNLPVLICGSVVA